MKTLRYLSCALAIVMIGFYFLGCRSNAFDATCYKESSHSFDPDKCEELTSDALLALIGPEYRIQEDSETLPGTKLIYIYRGEEKITGGYAHHIVAKGASGQIFGVLDTQKEIVRNETGHWQELNGYDGRIQRIIAEEDVTIEKLGKDYRVVSDGTLKYICYKRWRVTPGYDSFWINRMSSVRITDKIGHYTQDYEYSLYGRLGNISEEIHMDVCPTCENAPQCPDLNIGQ